MLAIPMIAGGLLSAIGAGIGANQLSNTMSNVEDQLSAYKSSIGDYELGTGLGGLAKDYMSIGSQVNQDLLNTNINTGMDFAAQNSEAMRRNLYSGGIGGFSGLQNQSTNQIYQQSYANANDAFYNQFAQNQKLGGSLLDSYIGHQRTYGENLAQGQIQVDAAKANMWQQGLGGLGEGLADIGASGNQGGFSWI